MEGASELSAWFGRLADRAEAIMGEKLANELALAVEAQAKENASNPASHVPGFVPGSGGPGVRTGRLRRSIESRPAVRTGYGEFRTTVDVGVFYGAVQEYGKTISVRHQMKNGRPGFMRWEGYGPWGGRVWYARTVTLPPRPFFWRAVDKVRGEIPMRAEVAWEETVRG